MKRHPAHALALVLAFVLGSGIVAAADPWVHIRVAGNDDGEDVRVNVPLTLVRTLITSVETDELRDGKIQIDDADFDDVDLRAMLEAVRDTEDAEFVRIRDDESDVRVAKEAGHLIVHVDPREGGDERVRVRVPMAVVEALLEGVEATGELNLEAAIDALAAFRGQDLVTVEGDDERVRIWIDDSAGSDD
jgi:hypothetical protein